MDVTSPAGRIDHAARAAAFQSDADRARWHDRAVWSVREKRDQAVAAVPEWEALRDHASAIKEHTLSRLDEYLIAFERHATASGVVVHWARDAAEHNTIVHGILAARGATRVVKSKSMLTEECGLNPFLAERGVSVVDTDLGERIVQLRREPPSHIVLPAIHLRRAEVGETFTDALGTPAGMDDPPTLAAIAREHLREHLLSADAAITGANFAIAETGGIVVCTNEGNADLGTATAPLHIASVGIEKIIPGPDDLAVFLRLLARSATGQPITVYTSYVGGPRPGQDVHVVLVDNGRTAQLARTEFRGSLKCIRCGACMNTCPVYRRSGGHSYGATVPGPIGSVLTPGADLERYGTLPFASTLCGSCTAVCPVKIDLDAQLLRWRERIVAGEAARARLLVVRSGAVVLKNKHIFGAVGALARLALRLLPGGLSRRLSGTWGTMHALPRGERRSFRRWYRSRGRSRLGEGR